MPTQQIPQDKWNEYLEGFSAHNQTRNVNVDIESNDLGVQRLIDRKPLIGVEPDIKAESEQAIVIVAGDPQGGRPAALTHEVFNPQSIWVKQDDEGTVEALDIESEDGRTILQFVA
jgi:hypothetical protein